MKKYAAAIAAILILSIFLCVNTMALDTDAFIAGGSKASSELAELQSLPLEEENSFILNGDSLNYQEMYKIFRFREPDIVALYKTTGCIADMIGENYFWEAHTDKGNIATIHKGADGKWEIIGMCFNTTTESATINKSTLSNILSSKLPDTQNLQYVKSEFYGNTIFAFIESNGKEYLIPFGSRPDLTGLANGTVYEASEAMDILYKQFGGLGSGQEEGGVGGIGNTETEVPTSFYDTVIIIGILLIIGLIAVVFIHQKIARKAK